MADINLYNMYNRKLRKYGLNDSTRFQDAFVDAVNYSYNELNSQVFESVLVSPIGTFEEVIDTRLTSFTTIEMANGSDTSDEALSNRGLFTLEYDLELLDETHSFIDTITYDTNKEFGVSIDDFNIDISDSVSGLSMNYDFTDTSVKFKVVFDEDGNTLYVNGTAVTPTYALVSTSATTVLIEAIDSHIMSTQTAAILKRHRALSPETVIYDFLLDDDSATVTDSVGSYEGTVADGVWNTYYIKPSSSLDEKYSTVLNAGLDFHLQDGGEWGLEPDVERERKWYGRGIKDGRTIYRQDVTYVNPLGL